MNNFKLSSYCLPCQIYPKVTLAWSYEISAAVSLLEIQVLQVRGLEQRLRKPLVLFGPDIILKT